MINVKPSKNFNIKKKNAKKVYLNNVLIWEKSIQTKLKVITGNIYTGQYFAVKLTTADGVGLADKTIEFSGWKNTTETTDSKGIAKVQLVKLGKDSEITAKFDGDDGYDACTVTSSKFDIVALPQKSRCSLATKNRSTGKTSDTDRTRAWSNTYSNCSDDYAYCTNFGGNTATHYKPAVLTGKTSGFDIPTGSTITDIKLEWKSKQTKYTGWDNPEVPPPTIIISGDGSGVEKKKKCLSVADYITGKGKNQALSLNKYAVESAKYTSAELGKVTVSGLNDGVTVKVQFGKIGNGVKAHLYFIGVKVTVTYRPPQTFT